MKKSEKSGSKVKKSIPVKVQAENEKDLIDRFWELVDLVERQLQHENRVSDELLSIIEMQNEHRESVLVEMQSIIDDELESAGICLECGEFIEDCGNVHARTKPR